jgi:hypothetical protein
MSVMWIPAQTTTPPLRTARRASGTTSPAGANTIAASSSTGGASPTAPAQEAPSARANAWPSVSPARVKASTERPSQVATWLTMCAAAPKPNSPTHVGSPANRSER